jgi:hypothetical protein
LTHNKLFKRDKLQLAVTLRSHYSQLQFAP